MADQFGNPSLGEALQAFVAGAKDLSLSRSLAQAQEAVDHIKANFKEGLDQRREMNNVAQRLVFDMTAQGANAAQVQQAYETIKPKSFASPNQAILEGSLSGDEELVKAGVKADEASSAGELARDKQRMLFQERLLDRRLQSEEDRIKLRAEASQKALTADEVKRVSDYDIARDTLLSLKQKVANNPGLVGIVAGRVPGRTELDPEYAAFETEKGQLFDAYRQAVTGAGASEGEIKLLESRMPTGKESLSSFLKKLDEVVKIGDRRQATYMKALTAAGRSTSGFSEKASSEKKSQVNGNPFIRKR